ncbi:MAG: VPLPA-CTERM sorting domain-containing protein [Nitrospira sp.]
MICDRPMPLLCSHIPALNVPSPCSTEYQSRLSTNSLLGYAISGLAAVPIPAAVWLFGSGLAAMVGLARRKAQGAYDLDTMRTGNHSDPL